MDVVLEHKDAFDWVYRGEGAANIVLAYTGSSPPLVGKVLRLKKASTNGVHSMNGSSSFSTQELLVWKDNKDLILAPTKEIAVQLYVKHVMSPLLGSKHVDAGIRVLVAREFLQEVERNISSQRPDQRINAAHVDVLCKSALLISDHSLFPRGTFKGDACLSVEIKPKCGFLPFSRYIAKRNAIKRSLTRFRMHQVLKFYQKEIPKLSEYDPLDLFSGSKNRILEAMRALYNTPQNNFRVFWNGSLILGCSGGAADNTTSKTGEALEDVLKYIIQAEDGVRTKSFLELLTETVYKSGILDRLLDVQKLDKYDVEGAIHAYYNVTSQPCLVCRELVDDEVVQKWTLLHSLSLKESLAIVRNFLIAATAKDCSLMFCFRRKEDGSSDSSYDSIYLDSAKQGFDYKVHFIDLDLKPLDKIEYYYELDQKIVSCYTEMVQRGCRVDGDAAVRMYESTQ